MGSCFINFVYPGWQAWPSFGMWNRLGWARKLDSLQPRPAAEIASATTLSSLPTWYRGCCCDVHAASIDDPVECRRYAVERLPEIAQGKVPDVVPYAEETWLTENDSICPFAA